MGFNNSAIDAEEIRHREGKKLVIKETSLFLVTFYN